jgi:signal transduction histidine kinase
MASTAASARERLHAMESLAAMVAHELRAGVMGVTSAAQLLRYAVPHDPVVEKSLGRILQESERLSTLHEALTEFATALPPRLAAGDPDAVWVEVIRNLRGAIEARSVLLTHAPAAPHARVRLDGEQLARALERAVHHALERVQPDSEVDIVCSVEDGWWISTMSAASAASLARSEANRPTFMLVLAQRTAVAHGGEIIDHRPEDAPLLVTIRLPLSSNTE